MNRRSFFRGVAAGVCGLFGLGCNNQRVSPAELPRGVDVLTGPPFDFNWWGHSVCEIQTPSVSMASKPWRTRWKKKLRPLTPDERRKFHALSQCEATPLPLRQETQDRPAVGG